MKSRFTRPSKGVWASATSNILALAVLIYVIRLLFIAAAVAPAVVPVASAQGPGVIRSRIIKVVEFEDRGRLYRVDLESGAVTFTDAGPQPEPEPEPQPEPQPEPGPDLSAFGETVRDTFGQSVKVEPAAVARLLVHAIDVTIAKAGGLGLKGQDLIDDFRATCDQLGVSQRIKGFPFGDLLKVETGGDAAKIIPALKEAKAGLEAVR